jgi:CDP-diacylglycerol---serine O-phosphatidyltransferase
MPPPRPRHFSMIRDFYAADFLTLGNGSCGTGAIFVAIDYVRESRNEKIYWVGLLIVAALLLDVLDGRVARWRHAASPLGRELDSLADVVSFGLAPACLAYAIGMTGFWDVVVLLYFASCGISRLARYNVTAQALAGASGKVPYFEGTPIPTSVILVLLIVLLTWRGRIGSALPFGSISLGPFMLHPLVLLFLLSGSLMISKTMRIPKP